MWSKALAFIKSSSIIQTWWQMYWIMCHARSPVYTWSRFQTANLIFKLEVHASTSSQMDLFDILIFKIEICRHIWSKPSNETLLHNRHWDHSLNTSQIWKRVLQKCWDFANIPLKNNPCNISHLCLSKLSHFMHITPNASDQRLMWGLC